MLIIFGLKRLGRRLATVFAMCGQCGAPAAQVIVRRSTWFSVFFVPVIPLGTTYSSTCTFCGVATRLDKDQALHTVDLVQHASNEHPNQAPQPGPSSSATAPPETPAPPVNP
jgi:hypothetical protein